MEDILADFEMKDLLQKNLDSTNDWLKFAEAKNAMLIGANIAIIGVLNTSTNLNSAFVIIASLVSIISSLVALYSFVPKTGKEPNKRKTAKKVHVENHIQTDILIFWGDQSKYTAEAYLKMCYQKYCKQDIKDSELDALEMEYAREIIYNANITKSKYSLFDRALWIDIIGIPLSIVVFSLYRLVSWIVTIICL
jgi:hypothetical protein